MPRPRKCRRVGELPGTSNFGPLGFDNDINNIVTMTVDEYETIRLIDLEKLTQEECAQRMEVDRTTVQAIYNEARTKIADALVNSKQLIIEGGDYRLCNGKNKFCKHGRCCERRQKYNSYKEE